MGLRPLVTMTKFLVQLWYHFWNDNFRHDNAGTHSAIATKDFLRHNYIEVMSWVVVTTDLNQIEHGWDSNMTSYGIYQPPYSFNVKEICSCDQRQRRTYTKLTFVPHFFQICDVIWKKVSDFFFRNLLCLEIYLKWFSGIYY